jgi:hypothetical protein
MEDRRDLDPAPPARRPATAAAAPPEPGLGGPGTARDPARRDTETRRQALRLLVTPDTVLRGSNFTAAFDAVLADAGIRTVLCNVRTPRMNAIAERWIGGCRREFLDRTLIWNQAHLRRILCQYETHHNRHRPHRSLNSAAPLKPLPEPVDLERYHVRRHARISGMINEYRLVA